MDVHVLTLSTSKYVYCFCCCCDPPPPPPPPQSPQAYLPILSQSFALSQLPQVDFLFIHHDGARHKVADNDGYRVAHSHQLAYPRRFCHLPLPTWQECHQWQDFEDRVDAFTLPPPQPHLIPILQGSRTTQKDPSRLYCTPLIIIQHVDIVFDFYIMPILQQVHTI